jgi:hypothetical protein
MERSLIDSLTDRQTISTHGDALQCRYPECSYDDKYLLLYTSINYKFTACLLLSLSLDSLDDAVADLVDADAKANPVAIFEMSSFQTSDMLTFSQPLVAQLGGSDPSP